MKVLILYLANKEAEFSREATNMATKYPGAHVVPFLAWRAGMVEEALFEREEEDYDVIAILCHGFRDRLMTGHAFGWRRALPGLHDGHDLAAALALAGKPNAKIFLAACSTGSSPSKDVTGDGGFADLLRDRMNALGNSGGWIDAHDTAGHLAKNPRVRRFHTEAGAPIQGGDPIVKPSDVLWSKWCQALKTDLRFRFCTMTADEIREELAR